MNKPVTYFMMNLLIYAHEDLQRLESYGELEFENEMLHDQVENQNGYINVVNLKKKKFSEETD